MLDTLAPDTFKPAEALLAPDQAQRIDRITRPVDAVGAFDRLLTVYDATERLQPRGYEGGLDRFVEDLALDIADVPTAARRVLAMAQRSLTEPELKAVFNVFQQAKGFWRSLLGQSRTSAAEYAGNIHLNEKMRAEFARSQQRLAHLIYSVGFQSEDSPEIRTFELMRTLTHRLSSHFEGSMKNQVLTNADNRLNGAFAQAAQMRMFQDHGYFVLVPDPDNFNDMKYTDLKGADFVAISDQGEVLLIDSKASSRTHGATIHDRGISAEIREYVFRHIQTQRKDLEGIHPGVDIVLGKRFLRSVPMTEITVEVPSNPKELGVGKFRGRAGNVYMSDINRQLREIKEYETAA